MVQRVTPHLVPPTHNVRNALREALGIPAEKEKSAFHPSLIAQVHVIVQGCLATVGHIVPSLDADARGHRGPPRLNIKGVNEQQGCPQTLPSNAVQSFPGENAHLVMAPYMPAPRLPADQRADGANRPVGARPKNTRPR